MEIKQEIITMLEMLTQPAFLADEVKIRHVNAAAKMYLLQPDMLLAELLGEHWPVYQSFTGDSLYCRLQIGLKPVCTTVTDLEGCRLFSLEQPEEQLQLQAIALASQQLREPVASMLAASAQFLPEVQNHREAADQFVRRCHQLLRRLNNMSDAITFADSDGWMEYTEMMGFFSEILEKTADLAKKAGFNVTFAAHQEPVYTMADREKLERALLNMLSNAMKFTSGTPEIHVELTTRGDRLYLSVTSQGKPLRGEIYTRFCRHPILEDPTHSMGLGMALVRSTAIVHGGVVLTDQPQPGKNRVTLTIPLKHPQETVLRSPVMRLDYAGGFDHCLVELSDVLPAEVYQTAME